MRAALCLTVNPGPNPPTREFKLFPEEATELGFLLLGCTSRLTAGGLLLGHQHYPTPLPPAVSLAVGLWNGKQGLGLYTHLLAVLAKLAVPSSLTLSPPVGGGLLPPPPVTQ